MDVRRHVSRSAVILPLAATLTAMACFQFGAVLAKGLFPLVGPQGAATLRFSLGAAMLVVLVRPWRRWPTRPPTAGLIGLGLSMAAAVVFFYLAITRLPLGVTVTLQFLGPLVVAVASSRRAGDLVLVAMAAAGVWSLVGTGSHPAALDVLGVGYALGAAAGWAGYIVCGRAAGATFGRSTAALATSIAALAALPFGIVHAGAALLSPAVLPLACLVALVSAALPISLELYALPRLPARTFATFTSLEPALAGLAGFLFLGERLSAAQWLGLALVIAAAGGAAWSSGGQLQAAEPTFS